jgi:integrase/recombinase XerC
MSDVVEFAEVPEMFERWLAGRPLAERSRREYARNARAYCIWLATTPDRVGWQGDPLTDPIARDHAARDFRRWLQVERRAAASTVNLALASLDALYRCLGLGRPNVRRDKPAQAAPRALDEASQRLLLRAAEAAPIRARALVMLMLFTALRISETVALDVDDVRITMRKGVLVVMGKGEMRREVPLNALVRQILDEWLGHRCVRRFEGSEHPGGDRAGDQEHVGVAGGGDDVQPVLLEVVGRVGGGGELVLAAVARAGVDVAQRQGAADARLW